MFDSQHTADLIRSCIVGAESPFLIALTLAPQAC